MSNREMFKAVFNSDYDKIDELLGMGVDINSIDDRMRTPLLVAIGNNNIEMIRYLLVHDATPNPDSKLVYTLPLNLAIDVAVEVCKNNTDALEDSTEVIELLLAYGADINVKDRDDESAYDFAKGYHLPAHSLFEKLKTTR